MLKILGRTTSANVQKVTWCCAELGLAFERQDVGGLFGRNRDPEYLAMNPNGLVPTIINDGFTLWESTPSFGTSRPCTTAMSSGLPIHEPAPT